LEELLQDYSGTVFLVSHDRAFVDRVATSIIAWEGDVQPGLWREYEGSVQDWLSQRERVRKAASQQAASPQKTLKPSVLLNSSISNSAQIATSKTIEPATAAPTSPATAPSPPAAKTKKLSFKEQRELDALPAKIKTLEAQQAAVQTELQGGQLYGSDPRRAAELAQQEAKIEEELMTCLERWEVLGA
jgi:ABC transport system ATP-binding/permease protein